MQSLKVNPSLVKNVLFLYVIYVYPSTLIAMEWSIRTETIFCYGSIFCGCKKAFKSFQDGGMEGISWFLKASLATCTQCV